MLPVLIVPILAECALEALAVLALLALAVWALWYGGFRGPLDALEPRPLRRGSPHVKRVALTFDDGPHPAHTAALLDVLREHGVKATFFVVGEKARVHPELVARMKREGHEVGNHTDSHVYMPLQNTRRLAAELVRADLAIHRATGAVPALVRPPWGARSPRSLRLLAKMGKRLALWSMNPQDYLGASAPVLAAKVIAGVRPGEVVLLHDGREGGGETVEAVRRIVPALLERGFGFATMTQLEPLAESAPGADPVSAFWQDGELGSKVRA